LWCDRGDGRGSGGGEMKMMVEIIGWYCK
jgi:hypothetical protein